MASRAEFPGLCRADPWPEARDPGTVRAIRENPALRAYIDEVKRRAAECRARPVASLPFSSYRMFDESGDRGRFEEPYFERRRALVACGLFAWLSGHAEDIAALEDLIWAICDEYTWALPAHLEGTSLDPRCLPGAAGPDAAATSAAAVASGTRCAGMTAHPELLDLFSCETAFALAEICYLFEGRLTPIVAERARREVRRRVLLPFLARKAPWRWELMRNNWCAVCAGSVGAAALYLVRDSGELAAILERVLPTMDRFLESFADDGTCLEGLGYWTYGVGFFVSFADLLERGTGGRPDLMANEKFRLVASFQKSCYLNGSMAVSFADGSPQERYRIGLTEYLSRRFPEAGSPARALAAGFGHDHCGRWCLSFRDLIWTRGAGGLETAGTADGLPGLSDGPPDPVWLPDAQWLLCPGRREGGLAFAAKGGHNDEPHNHNDIGSFELVLGERQLLADLGRGEYTRDYFSQRRYSIFCNSSFGHSLPIVDGQGQAEGSARRARNVEFRREGTVSVLTMDIAAAYDCEDLVRLTRRFEFDGDGAGNVAGDGAGGAGSAGWLRLTDEFEFSRPGVGVVERFVTACPAKRAPEISPEAGCVLVDAGEGDRAADAVGGPNATGATDATMSRARILRVSCSVPGCEATLSAHEHREHGGGTGIVASIDYALQAVDTVFACAFEFRLVPKTGDLCAGDPCTVHAAQSPREA